MVSKSQITEFQVPTASYRMGVPSMAYGLLTIHFTPEGREALAEFRLLWLPPRYPLLILYAAPFLFWLI
jgi:hypothetical protein